MGAELRESKPAPSYEIRGVRYRVGANADVTLLDELDRLIDTYTRGTAPTRHESEARGRAGKEEGRRGGKKEGQSSVPVKLCRKRRTEGGGATTHRADGLRHLTRADDDGEAAAAEGRHGELVLDVGELCGGVEDPHVV